MVFLYNLYTLLIVIYCVHVLLVRWAVISRGAWTYLKQFFISYLIINFTVTARLTRQISSSLSIHNNICVFILLTLKVNQNKLFCITPTMLVGSQTLKVKQKKFLWLTPTIQVGSQTLLDVKKWVCIAHTF